MKFGKKKIQNEKRGERQKYFFVNLILSFDGQHNIIFKSSYLNIGEYF
jgi:hypothetical protein